MFFIILIGTRFVTWGSWPTGQVMQCGKCGTVGEFVGKTGMRFVTFFFIPIIPAGTRKQVLQCPSCRTLYNGG